MSIHKRAFPHIVTRLYDPVFRFGLEFVQIAGLAWRLPETLVFAHRTRRPCLFQEGWPNVKTNSLLRLRQSAL